MTRSEPSHLHSHLGYWLRCLSDLVSSTLTERLAQKDISVPQWVVLRTLYDHRNVTLNQAADEVGVDKSSLSRMVERLAQRGLLSRTDGKDRRSVSLTLTPRAMKIVPQLAELAEANDEQFFHSLSVSQRKAFMATIQQLLKANHWEPNKSGRYGME